MSLGNVLGIIHQVTPPPPTSEAGSSSSGAISFLSFLASTLFSSSDNISNIINDNPGGCRKRSIPQSLEPTPPYDGVALDFALRPSLHMPQQIIVEIANWLSLVGSVVIILHIPRVMKQAPAQKTRMLIILFIAISNTGFALANVVTGKYCHGSRSYDFFFWEGCARVGS